MRYPHQLCRQVRDVEEQMPDHLGAALTAPDDGDHPAPCVDGMAQVVIRMKDLVPEEWATPRRDNWHETGSQHDIPGTERPAVELYGKGFVIESNSKHFCAKFDIGQAAGHPLQVLVEFLAAHASLRSVDEAVETLVGSKERQKGVRTRGVHEGHEVFQVRDLEGGLRKKQAGVPLEVRAPLKETAVVASWSQQCGKAEIEGAHTHADRVQRQISVHRSGKPTGERGRR